MTRYAKFVSTLLGAWFILALTASALHLYQAAPGQPPLAFGLAVMTPLVVFLVWFRASERLRAFTLSLNPRVLTLVQTWRVGGIVFLTLASFRILPWLFALPAGLGDLTIGLTAPWMALQQPSAGRRTRFILWQLFGMADLITAVALGTLTSILAPHGVQSTAMSELPLSVIPTFAVPLFFMLHVISVAQARRWTASANGRAAAGQPIVQPAV